MINSIEKRILVIITTLLLCSGGFGLTGLADESNSKTVPDPQITITKNADPTSCFPGAEIVFTITVQNTGNVDLYQVYVNDTLPEKMTYVSSTPVGTVDGDEISWVTSLLEGESEVYQVIASVDWDAPEILQNYVNASAIVNDLLIFDDNTADVLVNDPLDVEKSVHYNCVGPWDDEGIVIDMAGQNAYEWVTFRINVTNLINVSLSLKVEDILPIGLINGEHYYPYLPDEVIDNRNIIWYLDGDHHEMIEPGETITFAIRAERGECDVEYVNTVFITSWNGSSSPRTQNDTASVKWINCNVVSDIEQTIYDRGFPIRRALDGEWGGAQSFVPSLNSILKVDLLLKKSGDPEFDLEVELRENAPDGILIDSISFLPSEISTNWEWVTFDFDDVIVDENIEYYIVVPPGPESVSTSFGYEWGYAFGNQYDEGTFWFTRDGGNHWQDLPEFYEYAFKTYGYN
jgi:uncharacterized repeat protein (TIGR01451 family)